MTITSFNQIEQQFLEAEDNYQHQTCAQQIAQLRSEQSEEANRWAGYFEARLALAQRQVESAKEKLNALLSQNPPDDALSARLKLLLGRAEAQGGQLSTALPLLQSALVTFQENQDSYFTTRTMLTLANVCRDAALNSRQVVGQPYPRPAKRPKNASRLGQWLYFILHLPLTLYLWWRTRQPVMVLPRTIIVGQSELVDIHMTQLVAEAIIWYQRAQEAANEETFAVEIARQQAKLQQWLARPQVAQNTYRDLLHNPTVAQNPYRQALVQAALGQTCLMLGAYEEASALFTECLPVLQQVGDWQSEAEVFLFQGKIAQVQNDVEAAVAAYGKSLSIYRRRGQLVDMALLMSSIGTPVSARPKKRDLATKQAVQRALRLEEIPLYFSPPHQPHQRLVHAGIILGALIYAGIWIGFASIFLQQSVPFVVYILLFSILLLSSNWLPWLLAVAVAARLPVSAAKQERPSGLISLHKDNITWRDRAGRPQQIIAYEEVTGVEMKNRLVGDRVLSFYSTTTLYAEPAQTLEISGFTLDYLHLQSQLRNRLQAGIEQGAIFWPENGRFSWRSSRSYISFLAGLSLTLILLVTGLLWFGTRDRHELLGSTPLWESTYWGTGFWVFLLIAISRRLLPKLSRVTTVRRQARWPILVLLGGIIIFGAYFIVPVIQGLARPFSLILVGIGFWWVIEATRWLRDMSRLQPTAPTSRVSIWLPRVLLTGTLLLLAKFLWIDVRQSFYVGMYHLAQFGPNSYETQARYLAQAEALMPDDPWVYYWAACIHQAEEDYTAVLQDAAKGLSSGSRDRFITGGLYMRQGHGHFYSGQYELALADFDQARQYGYESIVPSLAMSLVNLDREEEAEQILVNWQPLTAGDYAGRAFVYHYYLLDYELALADYTQARDEGNTDYRADEIQLLAEMERPEEVQSLLQDWLPETAADYAARAEVYKSLADEEQVIRNMSEAIRLDADNPSYYYERAVAAYRSGQHAQAIADLDEAIRLNPSESVYYLARGHAAYSLGNYELAVADYTYAIENGWDDDDYIELRADAYWAIEDYDLTVADYLTLAQRQPHSEFGPEIDAAERLSQKARDFLNEAAYDEALVAYQQALSLDPLLPVVPEAEIALARARDFGQKGEVDEALAAYQTAVALDPTLTLIPEETVAYHLISLAYMYSNNEQYETALNSYHQAVALYPALDLIPEAEVARRRGDNLSYQGEFEAALAAYQEAAAADPNLTTSPEELLTERMIAAATNLVYEEKYDEALEVYRQAVLLNPDLDLIPEAMVAQDKGLHLAYAGDVEAALALLQDAQQLDPSLGLVAPGQRIANILITLASDYIYAGETETALTSLQQAASLNPDAGLIPEAQYAFLQADYLLREGEFDLALAAYQEAVALAPSLEIVPEQKVAQQMTFTAGRYVFQEAYDEALTLYQQAAALDPSLELIPEIAVEIDKGQYLAADGRLNAALSVFDEVYAFRHTLSRAMTEELAWGYGVICEDAQYPRYGDTVLIGCQRQVDIVLELDDFDLNLDSCRWAEIDEIQVIVHPICEHTLMLAGEDVSANIHLCQLSLSQENLTESFSPACQFVQDSAAPLSWTELASGSTVGQNLWQFTVEAGEIVTIKAKPAEEETLLILYLYGPDYHFLEISPLGDVYIPEYQTVDTTPFMEAVIEAFVIPVSGTYYVYVEPHDSTTTPSYTIELIAEAD